jgi:hypothetical protein
MLPLLRVLNDLSYVVECAAMDYIGEAKSELSGLCKRLEADSNYPIPDHANVAAELRVVWSHYSRGDKLEGSSKLVQVSRKRWNIVGA